MKPASNTTFGGKLKRAVLFLVAGLLLLAAGALTILQCAFPKVEKPLAIRADPRDSALVGRGDYLVNSVLACSHCHSPVENNVFSLPPKSDSLGAGVKSLGPADGVPGQLYAPNLTPAHLKDWTDGELFRLITTGIRKNGEPVFPVMPYDYYGKMDSMDVLAVIAYLRTLKSVAHETPPSKINFPVNFIMRTFPREYRPTKLSPTASPIEKGAYLVAIAGCKFCHSPVNNGQVDESRAFAGGHEFNVPSGGKDYSSNITPDQETGLGNWTAEAFILRFKSYEPAKLTKVENGHFNSVMDWNGYSKMTKEDLEAIYQYLKTVKPVKNKVERFML